MEFSIFINFLNTQNCLSYPEMQYNTFIIMLGGSPQWVKIENSFFLQHVFSHLICLYYVPIYIRILRDSRSRPIPGRKRPPVPVPVTGTGKNRSQSRSHC